MSPDPTASAVTVTQFGEHLVAVRSAHDPDAQRRMEHEAATLAQIDHPGVVQLVDHDAGPPGRLRTVFVGPDTWRSLPPTGLDAAHGLATIATTLADLHAAGLTHGDLRAEHVLVGSGGRPILCGFGRAGRADPATIRADIGAYIALAADAATLAGGDHEIIATVLGALDAGHDDLRATARSLERRRLPAAAPASRVDRRRLAIAGGVAAFGLVVATLAFTGAADPAPTAPSPPTTAAVPLSTTTPAPPPPAAVSAPDAPELVHQGRRYALGRAGDIVVTGDWECDGTETPALLRPETGEVAVFSSWPAARSSTTPSSRITVDDATGLLVDDSPCPTLRAITPTGSRLIPTGVP